MKLLVTPFVLLILTSDPISFILTETNHFLPIHREAPAFVEQATEQQILVTGIKVLHIFDVFLSLVLKVKV